MRRAQRERELSHMLSRTSASVCVGPVHANVKWKGGKTIKQIAYVYILAQKVYFDRTKSCNQQTMIPKSKMLRKKKKKILFLIRGVITTMQAFHATCYTSYLFTFSEGVFLQ